jgi:alpha-tubulin suppressor-like RCC1 family protein
MGARRLSLLSGLAVVGVALSLPACGARTSLRDELASDVPSVPDVPSTPDVPSVPDVPSTPDVPSVPDAPIPMDVVQLAAGGSHTCALRSTGVVLCWGSNRVGQLGGGTTGPRRFEPRVVDGLSDVVFIAAGEEHTCAVRRGGTVLCWGFNDEGQLGDGTTERRLVPTPVVGL